MLSFVTFIDPLFYRSPMSAKVTIEDHFKRLIDFDGREDRASFWPYAALVFVLIMIAGQIVFAPIVVNATLEIQQLAAQQSVEITTSNDEGRYSVATQRSVSEIIPNRTILLYFAATFCLAVLLCGAAVVRRLRDRGKIRSLGYHAAPLHALFVYSNVEYVLVVRHRYTA